MALGEDRVGKPLGQSQGNLFVRVRKPGNLSKFTRLPPAAADPQGEKLVEGSSQALAVAWSVTLASGEA